MMKRIIYFTSALSEDSAIEFAKYWKKPLNSSNQNFHNNLIHALATKYVVDVFSIRPINKNCTLNKLEEKHEEEENIRWHYIARSNHKSVNYFNDLKNIEAVEVSPAQSGQIRFVIVDTTSSRLMKLAREYALNHLYDLAGLCTDNPYNISSIDKKDADSIIKKANYDAYLVLTEDLNKLYNKREKEYIQFDGVISSNSTSIAPIKNKLDKPYIFFGGALMEKYGVYKLIKAFEALDRDDIYLVLCGHHLEENLETAVKYTKNVKYLGTLNSKEIRTYISGALCAVNPRPTNPQLDNYSVPSKVIEYLSCGTVTVSTENTQLYKYKDGIIWAGEGSVEDLTKALNKAINLSDKERQNIIKAGLKIVKDNCSPEIIGARIEDFLENLFYK